MHVRVKMMDTGEVAVITVSRITAVGVLKTLVEKRFDVKPDCQRLFYAGKQLDDDYCLYDYRININDTIQLMCKKPEVLEKPSLKQSSSEVPKLAAMHKVDSVEETLSESKYFKVGDYVDVKDCSYGSWFIGLLIKIKKSGTPVEDNTDIATTSVEDDGLLYIVQFTGCPDEQPIGVKLEDIRPHSYDILPFDQLKPGMKVLMNYNPEYPKERGYWFDVFITKVKSTRRGGEVIGDVHVGEDKAILTHSNLMFLNDIYVIKPLALVAGRTPEEDKIIQTKPATMRAGPLMCIKCKDDENKNCKICSCKVCGSKDREEKQIICDECDCCYHIECHNPPLEDVPEEEYWYCSVCKIDENEIVQAGAKLKASKKKTTKSKRDWGKGMACVGRTYKCNIVPSNHFGSIPGIEVGASWLYRVQVSEAGIHRPPVAGIHGRDNQGAFSLVLSGGYEDDVDDGDEFMYTGSGGRNLSGNKRTASQSCDQKLTRTNKALALNCNAPFNNVKGATAVDWKAGKPVRVVRNYKLKLHSEYAPKEGNRYDGIYKVVKYFPQVGVSGFKVWRFLLKRDDPIPAPWTELGQQRIAELGLVLIRPENCIPPVDPMEKRKNELESSNDMEIMEKKAKLHYELEPEIRNLIKADVINKNYWDDCVKFLDQGKGMFLKRVEESFLCICCQDIVFNPVSTKCSHNICKGCLKRSFSVGVYLCPACRAELGANYYMNVNAKLAQLLLILFPGYSADRH